MSCLRCSAVFVSSDIVAKCAMCNSTFHPKCTSAGTEQYFTKGKNKTWKCDLCQSASVTPASSATKQASREVEPNAILLAIASLKEDLNSNLNEKIGGVKSSIDNLAAELKLINNKVTALEEAQGELEARCERLERDKLELADETRGLRLQLQDQEQHSRCANVEITGLPRTEGENIYSVIDRLAAVLGVENFTRGDVSLAHRLRLFSKKHRYPPIIAQFVSRTTKEAWLAAAKKKRSLSAREVAAGLQDCPVYINHHLTPHNKALLGRARRMQKEKKLSYAGYYNGKVLVRYREGEPSVRVCELVDLDQYDK